MSFTPLLGFAYRNWLVVRRNVFTLFEILFWPFFGMAAVGILASAASLNEAFLATLLTGAIAVSVLQVAQIDVAYVLLFDAWGKSLKHTFLAPVEARHYVGGAWLIGVLRGLAVFAGLALFAQWAFGLDLGRPGAAGWALFLLGLLVNAAALGALTCALLLLFGLRAEVAAWSLSLLLVFLSGFYAPASAYPGPLYDLSRALPTSHLLEYVRGFYGGPSGSIAAGLGLSVLLLVLSGLALWGATERAKRTGMILKLSE